MAKKLFYPPAWLYEAQPYLYATAGVLTMIAVPGKLGTVSGILLVSAGGVTRYLRRKYRRQQAMAAAVQAMADGGAKSQAPFTPLMWKEQYRSGHAVMDSQHLGLILEGNRLLSSLTSNGADEQILADINLLLEDIDVHFRTEERLLRDAGHPISAEHVDVHNELLTKAYAMRERFILGTLKAADVFSFIAYDIIAGHVATEAASYQSTTRKAQNAC